VAQVFLGVLLAGSLLACGDDTSSSADEPTETVTVTEAPTPTPTPTPTDASTPTPSETEASTEPPVETTAPPVDPNAVPQTYDEAIARFDALGQEPAAYRRLITDTDIYCVLDDKALPAGCELGQKDGVKDPGVCGEALTDKVGRLEFEGDRVQPVCNTDTIRGDMPDVLNPGEAARAGDVQCLNDLGGVLCISLSGGTGFFARPKEYVVF
jgi:hypothetical protein